MEREMLLNVTVELSFDNQILKKNIFVLLFSN